MKCTSNLLQAQHDNIVGYYECITTDDNDTMYIIQEYISGGELLAQIITQRFHPVEASFVMKGLA